MKRTIRRGAFETNSSSSHSLTITKKSNYDKLISNSDLFMDKDGNLLTLEDVITLIKSSNHAISSLNNYSKENDPFLDRHAIANVADSHFSLLCSAKLEALIDEYEHMKTYTTDSGEELIAFCYEKEW